MDKATAASARAHKARQQLEEALFDAFVSGDRLNHDRLAEKTGVSRRTVYRYFPDRGALDRALKARLGAAPVPPPRNEAALLAGLEELFRGFDANATATMAAMATPEGRAARNASSAERLKTWRSVTADAARGLPGPDRTQATAAIQLLASGLAWREMRDQWHLPADQITVACRWAIEVLLADLRARKGKALSDGPARQGALL